MAIPQNQLEKFIKTIIDSKNSKKTDVFNKQELKSIALEMGFTEDEWKEYQEEIQKEINAGESFMKYDNTEDAIKHFQKAATLNPYGLEAHAVLAEAYKLQYAKTRRKEDRSEAINQARICLDIDINYAPAYELISQLKKKSYFGSNKQNTIVAVLIAIVVIVASVSYFMMKGKSTEETIAKSEVQQEVISNEQPKQAKTLPEQNNDLVNEEITPGIPVSFPNNQNLTFELASSQFNDYENSYSYRLDAYIMPKDAVINVLSLKVDVLDKSGNVLFSEVEKTVRKNSISYRPGDRIPFMYINYEQEAEAPPVHEVKVSVVNIKTEEAAPQYEKSPELNIDWGSGRPANYNVAFRLRNKSITPSTSSQEYQKLTLEAENTGNLGIKKLQIEIVWRDHKDGEIERKTAYIATTSDPAIKRGHKRLFEGTYSIPTAGDQIKDIIIKVVSIE